jgi:ankyrin repeat protein
MQDVSRIRVDPVELQMQLFAAIKKGEHFAVITAIDAGANPNLPCEPDGPSPLEFCILQDQFECFKTTYGKGADLTILIGAFKMSVLHFAAFHGRYNITWFLCLPAQKPDKKRTDLRGYMPLHYAATHNMKLYNLLADDNSYRFAKTSQGELPIHAAASFGNTQMVEAFIQLGNLAYERDNNENTPMHCAATGGHNETVQFLRTQKASKNYFNKLGETPFLCAVKNGHVAVARGLVNPEKNFKVSALGEVSAMHLAAKADSIEMVQFLRGEGHLDLFITDDLGRQPAHFAAQFGAINVFCYILNELDPGEEVTAHQPPSPREHDSSNQPRPTLIEKLLGIKDKQGQTVVEYAAKGRSRVIISRLVDLGVNVNVADATGCTAMHYVAHDGNVELMKTLKLLGLSYTQPDQHGSRPVDDPVLKAIFKTNPHAKQKMNPFHIACAVGDRGTIDLLVAMGIHGLYDVDEKGYNGLHHAARKNRDAVISHLRLTYNMDSKRLCNAGLLAVHHAVMNSSMDALQALVRHGDSYEEQGKLGEQPIHFACMPNNMQIFHFLREQKVNVRAINNKKQNCVFYAAFFSNIELLKILDEELNFEFTNVVDVNNSTPLHIALNACTLKVVKFLCGKGTSLTAINSKGHTPVALAKEKLEKAVTDNNEKTIDRLGPIVTYLQRKNGEKHAFFRGTASLVEEFPIPPRSKEEKERARAKRLPKDSLHNPDESPKLAKH